MANAKVNKQITSFADATRVTPVPGTDDQFEATIHWDWCGGLHAHGGFTLSLIFSTVRTYFLRKYPSTPQPDPINSNIHFIQPAPRGRVILTVTELSHARRYSTVEVKLRDPAGTICTSATVIQGNLATEDGPSMAVPPVMTHDEIPDRERCDQWFRSPLLVKLMPVISKMRVLKRKEAKTQVWSRKGAAGLNTKETWVRWEDLDQKLDVISLGVVGIQFLPAPLNFDPTMADLSKYVFPTMCMSVEIKKDPKDAEWLFLEIVCHKIQNGRYDTDVRVMDENGDLVALSKHVSVMAEMKRTKASKITVGDEFAKL
ncbi:uncharacterized protein BHQ10_009566 [Talaromyces amestolkiae]|uniref:Thioesterase domain-containing protein n=1 Tax=Talaromyces amestolkiae TaxID=1196081 RepID=A0A364LCL2_TALAM|nr:uncharacterized protein BHQ10_009566 [Talaromyces amestolkiae]RAO73554.1 hypothetical protein BHQ10_009566 [Talaromyces amestolkiae]